MLVLGVESAAGVAGAAVLKDEQILAEIMYNNKKTHSQTILPQVEQVLSEAGVEEPGESLDGIAITAGPGSFTGLRIGSAVVKGLAYAWNKPIAAVPTMDAMAVLGYGCDGLVCPIMDARRNQVYTGVYSFDAEAKAQFPESVRIGDLYMNRIVETTPMGIDELVAKLNTYGKRVTFLGDGVPVHRDYIKANLENECRFMPASAGVGRAGAVAVLGEKYLENGVTEDASEHAPVYLRQSQAERVRAERENSNNG